MATKRCPECDWEITDEGIAIEVNGKKETVCCQDCADKQIAKAASSKASSQTS